MRLSQRITCLAIVSILLTGGVCEMVPRSEPIFREDLIGDYAANFDRGLIDSLKLNDDSTYVRWFMGEDSVLFVDTGFWRMQYSRSPNDARHVNLFIPLFIPRYNISLGEKSVFSVQPGQMKANVPSMIALRILKTKSIGQPPIRLGNRFGKAYIKVKRKRE